MKVGLGHTQGAQDYLLLVLGSEITLGRIWRTLALLGVEFRLATCKPTSLGLRPSVCVYGGPSFQYFVYIGSLGINIMWVTGFLRAPELK